MEMKDLYYFDSRYLSSSLQVESIESVENDHKLITADYNGIILPVTFKQVAGKKLTDILTTGIPSLHLISNKLKDLLEENHLTGWKTYPIILKDKKENLIEGYHGFSVTGISGRESYINSPIIETRFIPEGPIVRFYKGITIDLSKWDGSDFFIPESTRGIVITRKVAELLERNKISNLSLSNIAEVELDVEFWGKREKEQKKKDSRE